MSWFDILKMPREYRGPDIRNEAQYEAASLEQRMLWHRRQFKGYDKRLKALQTQHSVDLTDVENPVYQEMKNYQDMRAFHGRQVRRIGKCIASEKTECNDYYSLELEGPNRRQQKYITTPTGKLDPYVELSLDVYNGLTDKEKSKYHSGMKEYGKDVAFHRRMLQRIINDSINLPTFPSPEHGGESTMGIEYTKEDYLNMDKDSKRRYHKAMESRFQRSGNKELRRWHYKMGRIIVGNSNSPTYFSPEHEQEEQ